MDEEATTDTGGAGSSAAEATSLAAVTGLHHVRIPVTDVLVSRDFYSETLGLEAILVTEEEDTVTGVVMGHACGVFVGLHRAPERAGCLAGFAVIGLATADLEAWCRHLESLGVAHGGIASGHLGHRLQFADPDGILIELHVSPQPTAEEA